MAETDPRLQLDVKRMARLRSCDVRYIVVHHSLSTWANVDAVEIDRWHRLRGWAGIGYHRVILDERHERYPDGHVQEGRPLDRSGAHTEGINHCSLGICMVGDGDDRAFTDAQYRSLAAEVWTLMQDFAVPLARVIGHCEINDLVLGLEVSPAYRTGKSCPGYYNPMDAVRDRIAAELVERASPRPPEVVSSSGAHLPTTPRMPISPLWNLGAGTDEGRGTADLPSAAPPPSP